MCATGSVEANLSPVELKDLLAESLAKLGQPNRVLAVPPDQSRMHSRAGELRSSEQRFTIRWCPGHLSKEEVEGVGFEYGDLKTMLAHYGPQKLRHGLQSRWRRRGLFHCQSRVRAVGLPRQIAK